MEKKIVAIQQTIEYNQREFLPHLIGDVTAMQEKGLEVEIQYGFSGDIYTALLIGRKVKGENKK